MFMWLLCVPPAGSRAWAGLSHEAVLAQVGGEGSLELPMGLPPVLEELLTACLAKDPAARCGDESVC